MANRLSGVSEYYFSQKLREIEQLNQSGPAVLNLGIGSPDLPPHPRVIEVLQQAAMRPDTHAYQSYKGSPLLRKAIARFYAEKYAVRLEADEEILPLIGSKEGILHICMTYLNPGDAALVPDPGYPTYASAVRLTEASPIPYALKEALGWQPDFDELAKLVEQHRPKLIFVNYPHMPTGQQPDRTLFERLVDFAIQHQILLVHDNPYSFILNPEPMSMLSVPRAKEVVLELNSLSKSHNMAGWRLGMILGAKQRIDEVLRFKSNMDSGMFLPVQLAAVEALSLDTDWFDTLNQTYKDRRLQVFELFDALGCAYRSDQVGLFVWAKVPDHHANGYALSDEVLYRHRVFITPGGIFGEQGKSYVRISLCASADRIREAITRIQSNTQSIYVV